MAVTVRVAPGQAGLVTVAQGASLQVDVDLVQLGVVRVVVVAGLYTPVQLLYTYTVHVPVSRHCSRAQGGARRLQAAGTTRMLSPPGQQRLTTTTTTRDT